MEVIVSMAALGGLYLLSNRKEEAFENKEPITPQTMPLNHYSKPNQVTDKYFKPREESSKQYIVDMADRKIPLDDFTSNNMVPYFKSEKNMNGMATISEQHLDSMSGAGSLQTIKKEVPSLFKPQENVQWANGSPNQTDFYLSRVNPGMKISNYKPFEDQKVGPGLNQGFGVAGSGGFNSGMESRETWKDKTVDDLRVLTNPKQTFELQGLEGPSHTLVKSRGFEGKMEKHLPDKFFINSPERYFTTTGIEQAPTVRSQQPDTIEGSRTTTTREYTGVAGNGGVVEQTQRGLYRVDHRQQLSSETVTPAIGMPRNNLEGITEGYDLLNNNRSIQHDNFFGAMKGAVSAISAPITDLLRPSRKENIIGACRSVGNPTSSVPSTVVFNPNDRLATTTRETTTYSPFVMGQRPYDPKQESLKQVAEHQPIQNQRDTTSISYVGGGMGARATTSYDSAFTVHANREASDRTPNGNATHFNHMINQQSNNMRSNTHVPYVNPAASFNSFTPAADRFGEIRHASSYAEPNRIEPSLLDAFKKNPYTHSLASVA